MDTPSSVVDSHYQTSPGTDIEKLHAKVQPTDVELLYARLPENVLPVIDSQEPLTNDQQLLHAKLIAAELGRQDYYDDDDTYEQ